MPVTEFDLLRRYKRIGIYGGSFDPIHKGHLAIGHALIPQFDLDLFVFIPAFHAPHKRRKTPTPALDRYAMVCLATNDDPGLFVSKMEINLPERPYSIQTLARLKTELPDSEIFFVIGADSWMEITTWRQWEEVLKLTNQIVVTRPGVTIAFDHVIDDIRERIVDTRVVEEMPQDDRPEKIYITDAVNIDISATLIREKIRESIDSWKDEVPKEVANYIEKYQIYS
jgi:nicotinate-nucleotide adenylyltransferase